MEKKCLKCGCDISENDSHCFKCLSIVENNDVVTNEQNTDALLPDTEVYTEYISIDVDGIIDGNNALQELDKEQLNKISELEKKKAERLSKEKSSIKVKKVFKILWIIFCGVYNSIYLAIFGALECFTLFGIPFGIVLFKIIPVAFNPIGKRVKLNFYKRPFLNLVWLLFGGWIVALIYYIYIGVLYATVVGIPFALQMRKVGKFLWCPFGAQILDEDEFSDPIVQKQAYTIQYLRKNKIVVDEARIDFTEKEKPYVEKIYKISNPINELFLKRGVVAKIALGILVSLIVFNILKNNFVIVVDLIIYAITKGAEPTGFLEVIRAIVNFNLVNFIIGIIVQITSPIEVTLSSYLSNIPYFNVVKIYIPVVISLIIISLIIFFIVKANNKKQARVEEIDYGYATKKQLIEYYDIGNKLIPDVEEVILKIYAEYRVDVEKEIENE